MTDIKLPEEIAKLITLLPKLTQAVFNDCVLYFSSEESIATEARKNIIQQNINCIREKLSDLEKNLV